MSSSGNADGRRAALGEWVGARLGAGVELSPLGGDASLRRYFRAAGRIAVDSPPQSQKNREFVDIDEALAAAGVRVPRIIDCDLGQGFLLLEDLGDELFSAHAVGERAAPLYRKAVGVLGRVAACRPAALPCFDRDFILMELGIFREWMLEKTLGVVLGGRDAQALGDDFSRLADAIAALPVAAMHRDFHSRNLMLVGGEVAVIDFQDMVRGPVTYDLASLVYDCYVELPAPLEQELLGLGREILSPFHDLGEAAFREAVNLVSLQRHVKVLGIFRRLLLRDGKGGYQKDLPRVLGYALRECARVPGLSILPTLLSTKVREYLQ
ncbi:MAG: phosphotransferase [Succinivibrionaceae bacterium]|nr:phosphotransferase [Succinivibrionaceae bacterium]